jgi:hypothetical protein
MLRVIMDISAYEPGVDGPFGQLCLQAPERPILHLY